MAQPDEQPLPDKPRGVVYRQALDDTHLEPGGVVDRPHTASVGTMIRTVLWVSIAFVESVLVLRFILWMMGVDWRNGFAAWVHSVSDPLVDPIVEIFGRMGQITGTAAVSVFELATAIAIIVYGLVGYIMMRLLRVFIKQ